MASKQAAALLRSSCTDRLPPSFATSRCATAASSPARSASGAASRRSTARRAASASSTRHLSIAATTADNSLQRPTRPTASLPPALHANPRQFTTAPVSRHAVPAGSSPPPLFAVNAADHERDNQTLRSLFDAPASSSTSASSAAPTGLFQIPSLTSPQHFIQLAQQTLARAQLLVDRIARANDPNAATDELRQVVRNLDRLSDLLCGVIDMAELVRNAHPDPYWAEAANAAYEYLCGYMNVLNTHTGLYAVLKRLLATPEVADSLSEEAIAVANVFLRDFEKSGIHLPPAERERFVQLSDEILVLGRGFLQDIAGNGSGVEGDPTATDRDPTLSSVSESDGDAAASGEELVRVPLEWLKDMSPTLLSALTSNCTHVTDDALHFSPSQQPWAFQTILKHAPDEQARRLAFHAANAASKPQIQRLERLLKARAELATLTGAASYADMSLADKMARKPDNVHEFLRALATHHRPRAARDLDKLRRLKLKDQIARRRSRGEMVSTAPSERDAATLPSFKPWDRDLYTDAHFRSPALRSLQPLSPFLSIGSVFAGLSRLFSALYGIRFRAAEVAPGEVWSEGRGDVMKVEVLDEREGARAGVDAGGATAPDGLVGTIYADLWSREGKPGGAAHYTVRCSRRVDLDDERGDFEHGRDPTSGARVSPDQVGGRGNPLRVPTFSQRDRPGRYQHPVVVLMCDFGRPHTGTTSGPCLLGWHEVETLFHEMGHALHSMLGRTSYHNVSGTRCATDFVELPSILMEHFLAAPAVVDLVARHYKTDARLPYEHLRRHLSAARSLEGLDTYHQIQLALLDQTYHSAATASPSFDSTQAYHDLDRTLTLDGSDPSDGPVPASSTSTLTTAPQTKFSHLFGYGATYYSYLLDRAIASRVFATLFRANPLDREAGEKMKAVLRYGGGKDAWLLLAQLLDDPRLESGGREAMRLVGRWGVEGIEEDEGQDRL